MIVSPAIVITVLIFWAVVTVQEPCKPGIIRTVTCHHTKADPEGSGLSPVACACHECDDTPFYACANAATKGVVAEGKHDGCSVGTCSQCKPAGTSCRKGDLCCDSYIFNFRPYFETYDVVYGYCSAQGKCALCAADNHLCRHDTRKKIKCCSSLTNHSLPSLPCRLSDDKRFSFCVADACARGPNGRTLYGDNCSPISKNYFFCACGEVNKKGKVVKDFKQCQGSSCEKCIPPGYACTPGNTERECCDRDAEETTHVTTECRNGKCQECFKPYQALGAFHKNLDCNHTKIPCCLDDEDPEEYKYKCAVDPANNLFRCEYE